MKYIVLCALSFFIGSMAGGFAPKRELRKQKQIQQKIIPIAQDCKTTIGSDLAQLMGGKNVQSNTRTKKNTNDNPFGDRTPEEIAQVNPEAVEIVEQINRDQEQFQEEFPEAFSPNQEELETARTALELRRAQARAALVEGADPSEEQLEEIDQAVQDMNDSLLALSGELTEMLDSGEEPERRQAMSFAAEALDTMLTAEESFRETLNSDQIESLDDQALDPFSYISPDILGALESLDQ